MKAFPGMDIRAQYEGPWEDKFLVPFTGMDLRDYFAAKAMQTMLSWEDIGSFNVSKEAYMMADAMMEVRNGTI
jgi:hypothetical protein